jgi:hypothetical protein
MERLPFSFGALSRSSSAAAGQSQQEVRLPGWLAGCCLAGWLARLQLPGCCCLAAAA